MSFQGDMSRSSSQPTLSQIVALSMTYKLIGALCLLVVIVTLAVPLSFKIAYFMLDGLTNDHTVLSLLLTTIATLVTRNMIRQSAPSKRKAEEALAQIAVGLPLLAFTVVVILIRFIVSPIEAQLRIKQLITWSPVITFTFAFRIGTGIILLGLSVILRFIGPQSIGKHGFLS